MLLLVGALAASPTTAFAQSSGASSEAAAQALFDQARGLMQAGKFAEACAKFEESDKLAPGAGTLLNLGGCYEKNGQLASAWATYADAASEADKANRKDWATRAKTRMAALQPELSKLSIVVPASSQLDGLEVKRDGVVVGASSYGVSIPVDPGPHVVDATAPGHKKWSTVVQVGAKKDQVAVTLPTLETDPDAAIATTAVGAAPPVAPPPTQNQQSEPVDESRGKNQRIVGIAVAGVGVVGLAVGSVFGLVAIGKKGDTTSNCSADLSRCNSAGVDAMSSARSAATISTVGFIAGGALLVGGIVLYVTAPKPGEQKTVGFRLTPNGTGASLSFGGAW